MVSYVTLKGTGPVKILPEGQLESNLGYIFSTSWRGCKLQKPMKFSLIFITLLHISIRSLVQITNTNYLLTFNSTLIDNKCRLDL